MQVINKIFALCLITLLFSINVYAEKYALIIAIGDYPEEGGWPDISSQNDIVHIKESLSVLGFSSDNIITLMDAQATKVGILSSFDELNKKLKKGDIVYIHFSGHGQQIVDDNGDEIDNLDESIVPYNSFLDYKKGFNEGENLIRDDELGAFTDKLRSKCGAQGQVLLILDSCHSGSGTRGMGLARGTNKIMAPDNFKSNTSVKEKSIKIARSQDNDMAPMASFFGASSRELNYETLDNDSNPVGSLSYAISSILTNMERNYSFDELFERVKLKMKAFAPRQNPQWEGPKNTILFGGQVSFNERLHVVSEIISAEEVKINVGTLHEIFVGSQVELLDFDNLKIITTGTISSASLKESIVTLKQPLQDLKQAYKVKITEKTHPPIQCLISNQLTDKHAKSKLIEETLDSPLILNVDTNADLYVSSCEDGSTVQITAKDGSILMDEKANLISDKVLKHKINNVIKAYTQGKFIKSYNSNNENYKFKLEVIQVDPNMESKVIKTYSQSDELVMKLGSCVKFKISNTGTRGAYFTLLDIQPDNQINLLIPAVELGYTADEYYLDAGETYTTDYVIEIGEPFGEETLKLISSKTTMDLSGIIKSNGMSTRGTINPHPFESLFAQTYPNIATRGTKIKRSKVEDVGTETIFFNIVK